MSESDKNNHTYLISYIAYYRNEFIGVGDCIEILDVELNLRNLHEIKNRILITFKKDKIRSIGNNQNSFEYVKIDGAEISITNIYKF